MLKNLIENLRYVTTLPKINPNQAKIEFKKGVLKIIAPKKEI